MLVYGGKNRNRAVHGDRVVVELLPRSEWRGRVTCLTEERGEDRSNEDSQSKPMPTGGWGGLSQHLTSDMLHLNSDL